MGALSRGCNTCKKRKVKCDETHPHCDRCCKSGIECSGFVPRLRFVDENFRVRRSVLASEPIRGLPSHEDGHTRFLPCTDNTRLARPSALVRCQPGMLHLQAFRDNIFMSYLMYKMFERSGHSLMDATERPSCGVPKNWIIELAQTIQTPRQRSWDALAAIVFGRAFNNQYALEASLNFYGQALRELHDRLGSPDAESTYTLASITAMYMHEMMTCETPDAWIVHANGLSRLVERRGPYRQKPSAVKGLYLEHRLLLISMSILTGQRTFLHHRIWKTVPWEDDPASKTPIDDLLDVGADIVEHTANFRLCMTCKSHKTSELLLLRIQVETSLRELNAWWSRWEALHPQSAWTTTSYQSSDQPLFSDLLEYEALWTAFTICIYDAMRILLLQLWKGVQPNSRSSPAANHGVILNMRNRTVLLGITSDIKGLACEILRSLSYCYRQSRPIVFTCSFLFIQDVVYGCFECSSKEAQWVADHGWAELINVGQVEDANLLRRQLPSGRIRVGIV